MCTSVGSGHGTGRRRRRGKHVQFDADEWRELAGRLFNIAGAARHGTVAAAAKMTYCASSCLSAQSGVDSEGPGRRRHSEQQLGLVRVRFMTATCRHQHTAHAH